MNHSKYHQELEDTAVCTKRMVEATKGIGQKYRKGVTNNCFLFDCLFSSNKLAEAFMEVGAKLVGMVKTNTKGFCKETIEKLTKNWTRGSYLLLVSKPMVLGSRPPIDIYYNYNMRKVLSFIATYNAYSTQAGIPCLYKYPDQFANVGIFPVARTLDMSKFFGYFNEVDSYNKPRQSDLALFTF